MQHVLTISEELYQKLQSSAQENGLSSIEKLLENWQKRESALKQQQVLVQPIVALRTRIQNSSNLFPDSVALLREDRERWYG